MLERERLVARVRQLRRRRVFTDVDERSEAATSDPVQSDHSVLEARITHLEQLVEGLQDAVHRESTRLSKRVAELEARTQPAALGKALSDDARERGL